MRNCYAHVEEQEAFYRRLDGIEELPVEEIDPVDEEPEEGLPDALKGAFESEAERLQRVTHPATVGIWDLRSGELLARQTALAAGQLRDAGTRHRVATSESKAALSRQANSCALATSVREQLLVKN